MTESIISTPTHVVSIVVNGQQVRGWKNYEITSSMLTPCDRFNLKIGFDRDVFELCKPDRKVKVLVDDTVVFTGRIDERLAPEDDEVIELTGRDSYARVFDESSPGINFEGLEMYDLVTREAAPWFPKVTFSNARNRLVLRGKGRKARAGGEPLKIQTRKSTGDHIEPGQTRATVIARLAEQAGVLVWSSGDGSELIVGQPNYNQEVQFRFFKPMKDSTRISESTCKAMGIHDTIAERYSRVIVVGSGSGTTDNYGGAVASRYGEAKDNPLTPEGDGDDFDAPKRLIVQRAVNSAAEAQELAEREMARRDAHGEKITVRVAGHGQLIAGVYVTIFAPDTLAFVEHEASGRKGVYLITSCVYRGAREGAEETSLELVPKGAALIVEEAR